jgi:hypothetical protein
VPRIKSILLQLEIDQAKIAHNCQANAKHRLQRGDTRLNVRNGRSWDRYCAACAKTIIERDIAELQKIQEKIQDSQT